MHIAIFVDFHDSTMGGVQTSVRGQRKGLEDLGHKVTIVCPPPIGKTEQDPRVICVPRIPFVRINGFPLVAPAKRNTRFIEKVLDGIEPIDIIHIQTNMGIGMMGIGIARRRNIPLVQTMHGRDDVFAKDTYPIPFITTTILRLIHQHFVPYTIRAKKLKDTPTAHNAWDIMVNQAQSADCIVMPSHHFMVKFREHGVTKPIEVISNGISDEVITELPTKGDRKLTSKSPLRVIWCGRLSPEKRPLETIEAISRIKGMQLDMYGNGPLAKITQAFIDAQGLSDRVHLKGKVEQRDVLVAMQERDILVYPSYGFDNQPMVLIEAVAAGTPVVYCDPDLTECMPSGGAFLTESTSVDSLVTALLRLQNNPDQIQAMQKAMNAARKEIVQSYHSKKMVKLYQRLIKQ